MSVFWNENDSMVSQDVPPEEIIFRESIITGDEPPPPVYMKAFLRNTNQSVLLNGQLVYPVIAKEVGKTVQVIIGEGKLFFY